MKFNYPKPIPIFDAIDSLYDSSNPYNELAIENHDYDLKHAKDFLHSYRGSDATYKAYRREIEKLLHWSWLIQKKSLVNIKACDIENFIEFCSDPPKNWISLKNYKRFIYTNGIKVPNKNWLPFVARIDKLAFSKGERADKSKYGISQKSLQVIFDILASFYEYLVEISYIANNPVAQIRQKSKFIRKSQNKTYIIRKLSKIQWSYIIQTAENMANENPKKYERTLFIMSILYGMYLRISELVASKRWQPQMQHFFMDDENRWWFKTVGKGNKERIITVSDGVLLALQRYRKFLNLTSLPYPGDTAALICKFNLYTNINSTRAIRMLVQECFDNAIQNLQKDGYNNEAELLHIATVHWLRHTGISEDVKIRPREHVRDDAGHASGAITDKYIQVELNARHASAKHKRIINNLMQDDK